MHYLMCISFKKKGQWYLNGIKWNGTPICVDLLEKSDDLRIDGDL